MASTSENGRQTRFFWAHLRAGLRPLLALAVVTAVAATVVMLVVGAVYSTEVLADDSSAAITEVRGLRSQAAMAIGIVAVLAAVVVAAAAAEPVRLRAAERALLRARGMTKVRLVSLAVSETILAVVSGALVGAAVGVAVSGLISGAFLPWWAGLVIPGVLTGVGVLAAAVATLRGIDVRAGRGELFAGIAALVLLGVVGGLAVWQFWLADGAAVTSDSRGNVRFDPLIAVAPALTIVVLALLTVVLARPIASGLSAVAARSPKLQPVLALRLAARRTGRHALTTGSVAFAAATIALAASYAGTLQGLGAIPEEVRVGTEVRVISITDAAEVATIAELDGVGDTMRAGVLEVRGSGSNYPLLAVESAGLGATMHDANGQINPGKLGAAIAVPAFGAPVPAGTGQLQLTLEVSGDGDFVTGVNVELLLVADDGGVLAPAVSNIRLEGTDSGQTEYTSAQTTPRAQETVPLAGSTTWRIVSITFDSGHSVWSADSRAKLTVTADGAPIDLAALGGTDIDIAGNVLSIAPLPNMEVRTATVADLPTRFPLVVTEALAKTLNVTPGSTLSLAVANSRTVIDTEVVQLVPLIPGLINGQGAMLDLKGVALSNRDASAANELWLRADNPTEIATAVTDAVSGVRVLASDTDLQDKISRAILAFVLAALGATALAAIVLVLRRSRAGDDTERELGVLAVLGLGRAGAARVRASEDAFAIVLGVLGGVATGLAIAWLIVPTLVRGVYPKMPDSYPLVLNVPWLQLLLWVLAALLLFVLIAASVRAPKSLARILREAE